MTVDCVGPTFLGRDLQSDLNRHPCSVSSLARSLDSIHLNGIMASPSFMKNEAAHRDVAGLDARNAGLEEKAAASSVTSEEESLASFSGSHAATDNNEPLLSPNEERFVMYPVRCGSAKMPSLYVLFSFSCQKRVEIDICHFLGEI